MYSLWIEWSNLIVAVFIIRYHKINILFPIVLFWKMGRLVGFYFFISQNREFLRIFFYVLKRLGTSD